MSSLGIEDRSNDPTNDYSWEKESVENLKRRILDDKTLTSRTDDVFLLSFLRARKFDEEDAFKYIKKYYRARKRFPDVFTNLIPSAVQETLDMKYFGFLNKTDGDGRVILISNVGGWDESKTSVWETGRAFTLLLDLIVTDSLAQTNGTIVIVDYRKARWRQLIKITPYFVYVMISCLYSNFPLRYKQLHFISDSIAWLTRYLIPFLPKKLKERMYIHSSNLESLHKIVGKKYLPADFGGDLPPFDPSDCYKKLFENEEFFRMSETYWTADTKK